MDKQRSSDAEQVEYTLSIPEAGRRYFGMSRGASYAAAAAGYLPVVRVGRRLMRVPIRAVERMLDSASHKPESA
jgi:hypothetical protein